MKVPDAEQRARILTRLHRACEHLQRATLAEAAAKKSYSVAAQARAEAERELAALEQIVGEGT